MIRSEIIWHPNGGRLVVAIPEWGMLIRCEQATDTFVEVIKRIGIERVKELKITTDGLHLVSTHDASYRTQRKVGKYYINIELSPGIMRRKLNEIAERLEILLYAEVFPQSK